MFCASRNTTGKGSEEINSRSFLSRCAASMLPESVAKVSASFSNFFRIMYSSVVTSSETLLFAASFKRDWMPTASNSGRSNIWRSWLLSAMSAADWNSAGTGISTPFKKRMVIVDASIGRGCGDQGIVQNEIHDPPPFVLEKSSQRERVPVELLVKNANHRCCISLRERIRKPLFQIVVAFGPLAVANSPRDIVIAQMKDSKGESRVLSRNL